MAKKPLLILAPMDDVTDTVFRQIIASTAPPDLFFTEFVNVDGLQSPGRAKLLPKLQFSDREKPIIAQIWGKNPANYAKTVLDLKQMGFAGVDINMGCPDKAVIKNGCCSALINNRELAGEIIKAVQDAAGEDFPVSVKTRLGFASFDPSWLEFLLSYKLNMLTIHGRTVRELSRVPAHWDSINQVRQFRDRLAPQTKIIGNGDVTSRQMAFDYAERYQLDGVMIGRGIFEDPYLFAAKSPWLNMGAAERIALYRRHVSLFADTWQNGQRNVHTLNKFCKVYINGFPGAKELREKLMAASSTDALLALLDGVAISPL